MKGRQRIMPVYSLAMSAALVMMMINASEYLLFLQRLEDLIRRNGNIEVCDAER